MAGLCRGEVGSGNLVKQIFQEVYLGAEGFEATYGLPPRVYRGKGLLEKERLLAPPPLLKQLASRHLLGIATGRPEAEARDFLDRFALQPFFRQVLTLEDCQREEQRVLERTGRRVRLSKPHPFLLDELAARLGEPVDRRCYVGDMPDDMRAALRSAAGFLPIGLVQAAPDKRALRRELLEAGARWVAEDFRELAAAFGGSDFFLDKPGGCIRKSLLMKQAKKQRDLLKVEFTEEVVKELLPEWSDARNMEIVVLEGGITNKLYRITSDKGDVAVRIYGDRTEMFINRDWEAEAIEKMAAEEISPKLVKYIPEQKVTIVEFVTGCYTLKNPDFLKAELHELIVDPVRRIHRSKAQAHEALRPAGGSAEDGGHIALKDVGASYPEFDIAGTLRKFRKLAEHTAIPVAEYTVSHNDLLAENFLLVRDPYKDRFSRPLYIIDWEYAGMAPRYYDIGDMFQEILVPREVEKKIVEHYCEGNCPDKTLRMIDLYKPYPDIYWFLWALIQKNVSSIKFDFYTYGKVKYDNAQKNLRFIETEYGITL